MNPNEFNYGDIVKSNNNYGSHYLHLGQGQFIGLDKMKDGFKLAYHSDFSKDQNFFDGASKLEEDSVIIYNNTTHPNFYSLSHFLFNSLCNSIYVGIFLRNRDANAFAKQVFILNVSPDIRPPLIKSPFVLSLDSLYSSNYTIAPKKFKLNYKLCR